MIEVTSEGEIALMALLVIAIIIFILADRM